MIRVQATTELAAATGADTVAVGLLDGERIHHDTADGALAALVEAGEAKAAPGHLAVVHADGKRWVLVGLGRREDLDDERLRVAAAKVHGRARELGTRSLCWELPHKLGPEHHPARAVVEGTVLAAHRMDRWKRRDDEDGAGALEELLVSDHDDRTAAVERAVVVAGAVNAARRLQEAPANEMTPEALAARARELHPSLQVEVEGRADLVRRGYGAFGAVAAGAHREPQLITVRHEPEGATGPVLGLVGKAVTFDTGGISLKPGAKMAEMKFDMSGGAAVLEAMGAIAALGLPVRVVAVVGATENMPGGGAMRPGDIVTSAEGLTIEVDNTDAEGRLVLADCLHHARQLGAERLVDVATLTGAIVVALGSTHTGLMASDDAWAVEVLAVAQEAGEPVWRLPLHPEYADAVKGRYADLTNAPEGRKAGSITAAEFLKRFTGDLPWVHLDIAGTAWDGGRAYAPKGGTGVMVRTLVALAERSAAG
ncbi:MAG TPA: leucyl aminopeptidase [Baekduia sp.]|nr:leucyl aminopeptidase [Baekduia sp.]